MRFAMRVLLPLLALLASLGMPAAALGRPDTTAAQRSARVSHTRTFPLPAGTTHFAVYWRGSRSADVRVALVRRREVGRLGRVLLDDLAEHRRGSTSYGALMLARHAQAVRVVVDRQLRVTVLALRDNGPRRPRPVARLAAVSQPPIILRSGWGADERLRFDSTGKETWPPAFYPVQKLIVHHTATQNSDPDPPATIRSIYYYHAVTQGWGDIGYNFLIDEAGRVYEGRHSFGEPSASLPGEDTRGYGVTAAHAVGYNSGTVGIALLGTLTNQDATPAARAALEQMLAWESDRHAIDPRGSSLYVNPVSGTQATFPNIAGHRDVGSTECPGGAFYATLPTIRSDVSSMLGAPASAPVATTGQATAIQTTAATLNGTIDPRGAPATYRFDYGRSTAYASSSPVMSAGSGTGTVAESLVISNLSKATVYHFRIVAIDASGGPHPGADATFRTAKR